MASQVSSENKSRRCKRKRNAAPTMKFSHSVDVFICVWGHLQSMCQGKELFAFRWLLKEEKLLKLFINSIAKVDVQSFSKRLLYNGYLNCKTQHPSKLSAIEWEKADNIFQRRPSHHCLPAPVKKYILSLSCDEPLVHLQKRVEEWKTEVRRGTTFHHKVLEAKRVRKSVLRKTKHCFLGKWDNSVLDKFDPSVHKIFRAFPKEFVACRACKNYVAFYDLSGEQASLVGIHVSQLCHDHKLDHTRLLSSLLCKLHNLHFTLSALSAREILEADRFTSGFFFRRSKDEEIKLHWRTLRSTRELGISKIY